MPAKFFIAGMARSYREGARLHETYGLENAEILGHPRFRHRLLA